WGGFTTQDLRRCRLLAASVALIYNWWSLFVRLADPDQHREVITSRPVIAARDCPQNTARRPDDTVGEQHAWRAADGAAVLSAHCPVLCQVTRKSGAVGHGAARVSHLERATAKISARPATDPARTPAAGLTRQLRLQIGAQIAAAPGVNCRI